MGALLRTSIAVASVVAACLFAAGAARLPASQSVQFAEKQPQLGSQVLRSAPPPGTPATVIDGPDLVSILGKSVRSSAGEDMGRVVDVLVSRSGEVRAAVIDFGGFLGVGTRKVAVDWKALRFPDTGKFDRITLKLTRDQVRVAPEYRPGEPVVVVGASSESSSTAPPSPPSAN